MREIRLANGLENNVIYKGQRLFIPQPKTFAEISRYVDNRENALVDMNPQSMNLDIYAEIPNGARIVYSDNSRADIALR